MCGITGIFALNENGNAFLSRIPDALSCLEKRGPDAEGIFIQDRVALGHRRLSIIDLSEGGKQPMTDDSGRYTIVFNGEFFNYQEHRQAMRSLGVSFSTDSDTEVLLKLFIQEGPSCLQKINGFFALAIYDANEKSLFLARDRMGVKPLLMYSDADKIIFASEMKALLAYGIERDIDQDSLFTYFQLNYIPGKNSIFQKVKKLSPGHYLIVNQQETKEIPYYEIPNPDEKYIQSVSGGLDYQAQQIQLRELLTEAVRIRLVSDVPLGAFLSGGIDSSVIVALAAKLRPHLDTFSIGYKDEPFFDETHYAKLVAEKYKTNHTVFSLTNDDLYENLFKVLDYIDEPFADSSALPVHILSMHTRKHVTVALSGDGADEMFAGYNKHKAEYLCRENTMGNLLLRAVSPALKIFPASRNSFLGNKVRQMRRYYEGLQFDEKDRYWRWCAITGEQEAMQLFKNQQISPSYRLRKAEILRKIHRKGDMNEVLLTDMELVLPNDMLTKVDLMSMANSLEVRNPFLDYRVVNFAFGLPLSSKIDRYGRKKILKDAFRAELPQEIYQRGKKGFEVPLLKWFKTELRPLIEKDLLNDEFIISQGVFNVHEIRKLKAQLFSSDPEDIQARIWNLIVFQYWWKKHINTPRAKINGY